MEEEYRSEHQGIKGSTRKDFKELSTENIEGNSSSTLLATALAIVDTPTAKLTIRMLIDTGSQLSFVSNQLHKQLKGDHSKSTVTICGIGGKQSTRTRGSTTITLQSLHSTVRVKVKAHILNKLTSNLPEISLNAKLRKRLQRLKLADPDFLKERSVDVIIGADSYGSIINSGIIRFGKGAPIAQQSRFGWVVLGPVGSPATLSSFNCLSALQHDNNQLQVLLRKFWEQEELPNDNVSCLTREEEECEQHFKNTHSRDSTGRYVVRIPLNASSSQLGHSYTAAHHWLQRTLRRFHRDEEYRKLYMNFMKEYEELKHMRRVPVPDAVGTEMTLAHDASASGGLRVSPAYSSGGNNSHPPYYLPHHGVLKPDSSTTKLRVVFNGSCTTSSGKSVNDIMHTGANLLLEIGDVLTWIRHHRQVFATDITKMYRQINVHRDDWDLQRILWIDENFNEVAYQLTTVTYGTKAAPFLAVRVLLQLAEDEGKEFPLAVPSLLHGRYVDDIYGGVDSGEQLIEKAKQLRELCLRGGFPLAKWHSTHTPLLTAVADQQETATSISLDDCETKVLGLQSSLTKDSFTFKPTLTAQSGKITKRIILSEIARIFDPLGFLAPLTITAKILLQELVLQKLDWDEELPTRISVKWNHFREDLKNLAKICIPRWFNTWSDSTIQLHGFSDASPLAMSAVIYLVVQSTSTNTQVSLVCAKTKVSPLKKLSIPRLELAAALLMSKLVKHVKTTMKLPITSTHLWTDSVVTLTWIKTQPSRWKEYVRNRVTLIQQLTERDVWHYVPSTSNPADCASRGLTTSQLYTHKLWWTGPSWLQEDEDHWPKQPATACEFPDQEARTTLSAVSVVHQDCQWDLIQKYSTLSKLFRITALCQRFIARLKRTPRVSPACRVQASDVNLSKIFWVKQTQRAYFAKELKTLQFTGRLPKGHPFTRLTAFIDDEGIIRVGGRLLHSALSYEAQHPAILPRHSRLASLIIQDAHHRTLHGGTQLTLSFIRNSYWIIGGRAPVKSYILKCVVCARQRGIRAQQLMGQLPLSRVTPTRPFTHTGIDYAGPITLKAWKGRGSKTHKGWICVFVCLTTSAVHLEIVTDYSTEGFISTYKRFISRRGIPQQLYSDCGTNFLGADSQIKKLFLQSTRENQAIVSLLSKDHTHWNFNPPAAPHMGGKWEAVVKSTKFHLNRILGDTLLTYEEYATLLSQIEAILNSRPLEALSDDPEDVSALTPGHFLIGSAINTLPEPSLSHLNSNRLSNWQLIQQKVQSFWTQWSAHYLQKLQSISRWHHSRNDIKIGTLVLITSEQLPPCKWPLARVIQLHPGDDGLTRVVTVKTATTTLVRPIAKLAVLPIN